jgi:hypothetical protein
MVGGVHQLVSTRSIRLGDTCQTPRPRRQAMSTNPFDRTALNFRRYKDGDSQPGPWRKQIFQASHTYKCPTYIQSTPPCQGSCPSGEDIRGWLAIVRGTEKPPVGAVPVAGVRLAPPDGGQPLPLGDGPRLPGALRDGLQPQRGRRPRRHQRRRALPRRIRHREQAGFAAPETQTGKKVAVIGGGPAGLSAPTSWRARATASRSSTSTSSSAA